MAKAILLFKNAEIPSTVVSAAKEITMESFKKSVDSAELNSIAESLGYYVEKGRNPGKKLFDDGSVIYYATRVDGKNAWLMEVGRERFVFSKVA